MGDALKRLDKLTHEEARMAIAQNLKATHSVDDRVKGVVDKVLDVGDAVRGVDARVANVDDGVKAVNDRVIDGAQTVFRSSKNLMKPDTLDGRETRAVVDQVKRSWSRSHIDAGCSGSIILSGSQLRQDLHRWLSPPDPSTNHNIACSTRHKGTADWFFEGSIFAEWKSAGSLLWVHGKRTFPSPFPPTPTDYHDS